MKRRLQSLLLIFIVSFSMLLYINNYNPNKIAEVAEKERLNKISSHYNKYVITNKESILYDDKEQEVGKVNKNIELELADSKILVNTKYFKIANLNYYIKYEDVEKIKEMKKIDHFYKNYIPFNFNVVTKDKTILYDDNGYKYELNTGIDKPVIIDDYHKYYIEYNNELLYVKDKEVDTRDSNNSNAKTRKNIRTLTYHTVYKPGETCSNTVICEKYADFDKQMKYLRDNDYLALRMPDLELFLDKKINIPKKSIVITLDDGKFVENAVEILEKYKIHATFFVITGRYDVSEVHSEYAHLESHTDNMHNNYKCPGGEQGGQLLCETEENILKDLKLSQEKLGGSHYFAYPFFDWNDRAIRLLKQAGFRLAFVGQWNTDGFSTYTTNRMKVPRKTIFSDDSMDVFISYLN